jgi:hypothetical protein
MPVAGQRRRVDSTGGDEMHFDGCSDGSAGADERRERGAGVRLDRCRVPASIASAIGSNSASRNASTDASRVAPVQVSKPSIHSPAAANHCRSSAESPAAK